MASVRPVVAFGPEMPGWGSWDWLGADLVAEVSKYFPAVSFAGSAPPDAQVVFVVKHAPTRGWLEEVTRHAAVVYCPVDYYGGAAAIDADGAMLRKCSRILVHCDRLRRYFEPYAPVESMDHHVKFAAPERAAYRPDGEFLWVGVRTNLPPLVEWVNAHPLPGPLRVLTNPEQPGLVPSSAAWGFQRPESVGVEEWSAELHRRRTAEARAALDFKGRDFRQRHKSPAKAIDFIASGVPLAMNADSSPVEHLARMGFEAIVSGTVYASRAPQSSLFWQFRLFPRFVSHLARKQLHSTPAGPKLSLWQLAARRSLWLASSSPR